MTKDIYQSMTGEIQCIVVNGILMVREWPEKMQSSTVNPIPWRPARKCEQDVSKLVKLYESGRFTSQQVLRRLACKIHALEAREVSAFRVSRNVEMTNGTPCIIRKPGSALDGLTGTVVTRISYYVLLDDSNVAYDVEESELEVIG